MRTFLRLWTCAMLSVAGVLQAADQCGAEVKLLLVPAETQAALTALNAGKKMTGQVYFFDTHSLDLLSQGVIVRLRKGATADLTLKLRLPSEVTIVGTPGNNDRYKCEADLIGGEPFRSYSVQTNFTGAIPKTGTEVLALLSPAQQQLLQQEHVSIDWTSVSRIADIKSTDWQIKSQPPHAKLVLELWEWPTGEVLELSTRVATEAAPATYTQLKNLLATKGLALDNQKSKTALALENIVHTTVH